jgi:hypothetical protein
VKRGRSIGPGVVAVAVVATVLALLPPRTVAATSSIEFGTPSATSTFGTGVEFLQPVDGRDVRLRRAELLVRQPGDLGPLVIDVPTGPTLGRITLSFTLLDSAAHIYPNTALLGRWRVVDATGAVSLGPEVSVTYADTRFAWQSAEGRIVRVHWSSGSAAFGRRALELGEAGVARAEKLLGVTEAAPIDFFVYPDQASFYDALGPAAHENVGGEAIPEIRTLFALIEPGEIDDPWVGIVIPHELTHLVFDTTVENPYRGPPRWLDEGLAVYLSQGLDESDRTQVRTAAAGGDVMPLDGLTGQFPSTVTEFSLAYAESVAAVDFLVRTYGDAALVKLIRSYRDGVTDDEAFQAAIGLDAAGFNERWLVDIGARAPVQYGPQPAPRGPAPSDWLPDSSPAVNAPRPSAPPAVAPSPVAPAAGQDAGLVGVGAGIAVATGLALLALRRRGRRAA